MIKKRIKEIHGELFILKINDKEIKIRFSNHSLERVKKWELSMKKILETLLYPEEVLVGHNKRFIAHRRYGKHIIRAIYEYEYDLAVLVTVHYPYAERYFKGGGIYANKIFS